MTKFDAALAVVLQLEGGRVDDPRDPGGRTNQGVTQRTFDAWRRAHGQPTADVYRIEPAEVAAIYRNAYADPVRFEALPAGVGLCVLDDAVNSGTHESAVELQRALGLTADGVIGALTLAAVAKTDPVALIGKLCDGRLGMMRQLRAWATFGRGWSARVAACRKRALEMAAAGGPVQGKSPATGPTTPLVPSAASAPTGGLVPPCTRPGCPLAVAKAA